MEHASPAPPPSRRPFSNLHDAALNFPRLPTSVPHDSGDLDVDPDTGGRNADVRAEMAAAACQPQPNLDECCYTCSVCFDDVDAASLATTLTPFGAPLCGAPACAAAVPVLCRACAKQHVRTAVSSTTRSQLPVVRCIGAVATASGGCGGAPLPPRLWVSIARGTNGADASDASDGANGTDNADGTTRGDGSTTEAAVRGDDDAIWADVRARACEALTLQCGACHKRGSMLLQALPADGRALAPLSRLSVSARAAWQRAQAEGDDDPTLTSTNMGDALLALAKSCFGDAAVQAALAAAKTASARSSKIAALAAAAACAAVDAASAAVEVAVAELRAADTAAGALATSDWPAAQAADADADEHREAGLQERMVHRRRYRNMLHVGVAPAAVRHRIILDGHFSPVETNELMLSIAGAGWEGEHEAPGAGFLLNASPALVRRAGQVLLSLTFHAAERGGTAAVEPSTEGVVGGKGAEKELRIASLRAEVARCLILTGALDDLIQQHHATQHDPVPTRSPLLEAIGDSEGNDAETAAAAAALSAPTSALIAQWSTETWNYKGVTAAALVTALLNLQSALTSSQGLAQHAVILVCRALTGRNVVLRASLQLALYRTVPRGARVRTLCCGALHCFSCKSQGYHDGKTCAQNQAERATDDIVPCPECGTSIVKGDGCGSIVCVCGHGFSWSIALARLRATQASAWQRRFEHNVEAELATETLGCEQACVCDTAEEPLSPRTAYTKRRSQPDTVDTVGRLRTDVAHRVAQMLESRRLRQGVPRRSPQVPGIQGGTSPPLSPRSAYLRRSQVSGGVFRCGAIAVGGAVAIRYRKRLAEVSSLHAAALVAADTWFSSVQELNCDNAQLPTDAHQLVQCAAAEEHKVCASVPHLEAAATHYGDRASLLRAAARDLYIPCLGLTLGRELAKPGPAAATHVVDAKQPDVMLTQAKAWLHTSANASAVASAQEMLWENVCASATIAADDRMRSVSEACRARGEVELAYSATFLGTVEASRLGEMDGGGAAEADDDAAAHGEARSELVVARATRELFLRTDPSLVAAAAAQHHREALAQGGGPDSTTPVNAPNAPRHLHAAHGTVASQLRSHPLLASRMGRSAVAHGGTGSLHSGCATDIALLPWAKSWAAMHPKAMARVCIDALTTYDMLQTKPLGLRRDSLQTYLPDSEFWIVFGMCRDEFNALPEWKQRDKKRAVGLF